MNETVVFSGNTEASAKVLAKLKELNVQPVKVDFTSTDPKKSKDLLRTGRTALPINIVYPSNYSASNDGYPAILIENLFSASEALEALEIAERWSNEK